VQRLFTPTRYGIAVLAAALAVLLRAALDPVWGAKLPLITFFPAIMVSAWLGGFGPGLLTTLLTAAAAEYFWMEAVSFSTVGDFADLVGLLVFVGIGAVISALNEAWRRSATAVAESEKRLKVTLASIGDAVIATDPEGRVTLLNEVAEALTGWSQAEAAGRPMPEVFVILNEESRRPAESPVGRVLRDGVITGLANHTVLLSRDGREIPIDDSAAPIRASDGRLLGVVMVFRDITERRRDERERVALLQSERAARTAADTAAEQLRLGLEAGRMGTWEWMIGAGAVRWSPGLEAIHGLSPGGFPGTFEAFQKDIHPDDRARVLGAITETVEQRSEHHVEYRIVRPDGAVRWVEGRGRFFLDAEGRPGRMVGICSDVTERKAAEARLGFLGEIARSITSALDLDTVLQRVVDGAQALCGSDTAVIFLREGDSEAMVPRYRVGPVLEAYARIRIEPGRGLGGQVLLTGRPARTTDYLADGRITGDYHAIARATRTTALMVVPLLVADRVEGLLYVGNTFARPFSDDDEMVCVRLAEQAAIAVQNAQLFMSEQEARREAEAADRAKDQFLAVLSHELRTPLTAMLGWLRMLRTGGLDPLRTERALETIERNTLAQARMIDDLLDMSRIAAGKMTLDRRPVSLAPMVAETVDGLQNEAKAKGVTLVVGLDPAADTVLADVHRMRQVLMNLLVNAIKYTPAGGHIDVDLIGGGDVVRLTVRDTGIGIEPESLPHIFERFWQADWRQAGTQGGLGLGLAIVRRIGELHGGSVEAASDGPGRGAAFTVTLPAIRAATGADPPAGT